MVKCIKYVKIIYFDKQKCLEFSKQFIVNKIDVYIIFKMVSIVKKNILNVHKK